MAEMTQKELKKKSIKKKTEDIFLQFTEIGCLVWKLLV